MPVSWSRCIVYPFSVCAFPPLSNRFEKMYSGRRGPGRPRTNPPSYRRSAPVEVLHDLRPLEFLASVFRTPGENDPPSWVRSPDEGYTIDYLLVKATRRKGT